MALRDLLPPVLAYIAGGVDSAGNPTAGVPTQDAALVGKGDVQASVSTVVTLAAAAGGSIPAGATSVYIQPEGGDIRMRRDGVDPTASVGLRIYDGTSFPITGLTSVKLVAVAGTVTVNLQFLG
jgi:predicted extracellular nuclease